MRKAVLLIILCIGLISSSFSIDDAQLLRFPDINKHIIIFVCAGDIWSVSAAGGVAKKLTPHEGPKIMLINYYSGSGGDAFPYYFKKKKLGILLGTRTWGGLVGVSGNPRLADGGYTTVPTFGF